ncbi:hypothetical protein PQ465_04300 [Sphingobacterium oryzagri]|uniref:Uncharacterized protein n=1 Tax=Sphingobacterium oryzagri TaxID=3025669 RepID=A0ABY7WJ20_9SPHI|nr:hypothetical protein [Sphingobacterium sp. KACC 22765]WDF69604.1 hypothetical protein PQ465_04300 [Sphingobacterium sp. KACC 22765]
MSDRIVVEVDDNQDRYNSNFYNKTYKFSSVEEFKPLFSKLVLKATIRAEQKFSLNYRGFEYPIYIELSNINKDRRLGIERIYDLHIYDGKGLGKSVARVSEYPQGNYNLVHVFEDFDIGESEIIDFFIKNAN